MKLTIDILGQKIVIEEFRAFQSRLGDFRPAWRVIARDLMKLEEAIFNTRGQIIGAPWAPLSPKYARWKERKYPGRPQMVLSGRLLESLTDESSPDMILITEPHELVFGSARKVGRWYLGTLHQLGTRRMPARKIMPEHYAQLPPGLIDRWERILGRWIVGEEL